jgi:hypothetical protein
VRTLAALAAVAALTAVVAPARAASPATFVSKRFGYSIVLTRSWSPQYAITAWPGGGQFPNSPTVDTFADGRGHLVIVAARRVAARTTLAEFTASVIRPIPPVCGKSHAFRTTSLGGAPASDFVNACTDGLDVITATALHGGRGYVFWVGSPTASAPASGRALFERVRRSLRFLAS